jgi:ferredoxin-NADP reductase
VTSNGSEVTQSQTLVPPLPARTSRRGPIRWRRARVVETLMETRDARTLVLDVPGWPGHDAGQHVDVRLTAEDGYTAQRSFSIASADARDRLELTVQKVTGGEVSPYLVDTVEAGDEFELRGPVGGWFRWTEAVESPVSLIAGGSGIVPLMAMVRARVGSASTAPFHLTYSVRTPDHVMYANELFRTATETDGVDVAYAFTRAGLPDDVRGPGRLTAADLATQTNADHRALVFICGPNGFVEHASRLLTDLGHPTSMIRTERFGPTGG